MDEILKQFFAEYEARFNKAISEPPEIDVQGTAAAFSDCFIEASPTGVVCGKNDEQFRAQIPKGLEFYRSIGTKSMLIASLSITSLDDRHSLAKVHWKAQYQKRDGQQEKIDFDVIYLVQTIGGKPKIFAYIVGDEERYLRERGLI
jgi:hypothetical protein